jgi:hypothetical protein
LPLFSARRRIPAQAFWLKKNLGGSSPISKVSDNEHTAASLGHSEVLSVKHSVCEPIPEFCQRPEEGTKVPPTVATEDTRHVFPYAPLGSKVVKNPAIDKGKVASGIGESFAKSGDGKRLARRSTDQKVNCSKIPLLIVSHITKVFYSRIMVRQHSSRERLNLCKPYWLPA